MNCVPSTPPKTRSGRAYRLGRREESARQTKDNILGAAAALLAAEGPGGMTMGAVARQAAVSRVTVYDHFRNKAGLLEALAWRTFGQHDIGRIRQARLQPDVRAALVDFVKENTRFFASFGIEGRAVLKSGGFDPDVARVVEVTYIDARRAAIRELVQRLDDANELGPSWPWARAVDALMIITSLEAFETLIGPSELTVEDAANVLASMARALLA